MEKGEEYDKRIKQITNKETKLEDLRLIKGENKQKI